MLVCACDPPPAAKVPDIAGVKLFGLLVYISAGAELDKKLLEVKLVLVALLLGAIAFSVCVCAGISLIVNV